MSDEWRQIEPGTHTGVSVRSDGSIGLPDSLADHIFGEYDRAAVYVKGSKIGIRVGADPDTTYTLQHRDNRTSINALPAVRDILGKPPEESAMVQSDIIDTAAGKMLVVDLGPLKGGGADE